MSAHISAANQRGGAALAYTDLQERILARDQVGASDAFYDLVRRDRPFTEIVADGVGGSSVGESGNSLICVNGAPTTPG